jgi:hypothetical protein
MTGAEQVLIEDWCQQYPSHSIGAVEFGRDGALYASGGDGASFNFVDYGQDGSPPVPRLPPQQQGRRYRRLPDRQLLDGRVGVRVQLGQHLSRRVRRRPVLRRLLA